MQNSTVSGALTYQELCMAACNEEQRKAKMKKRRQYRNVEQGPDGRGQRISHNQSRNHSGTHSYKKNSSKSQDSGYRKQSSPVSTGREGVRLCYQCGKPGHLARDCRASKSESRGGGSTKTTTKQVTTLQDQEDQEDPRDYLLPDSDNGGVKLIHVRDRGSRPRRAQVWRCSGLGYCGQRSRHYHNREGPTTDYRRCKQAEKARLQEPGQGTQNI